MKDSNTLADNATIKQLQKTVLLNTKGQYMDESNTLALIVTIKQDQKRILHDTKRHHINEGIKYPCSQCNHKASSKGDLAQHKMAVYEGVKYPCEQCNHQATYKRKSGRTQKGST